MTGATIIRGIPSVKDELSSDTVLRAFGEIKSFWRILLERVSAQQRLISNVLVLLGGASEGVSLFLLIPLIQSLDPDGTQTQGAVAYVPKALEALGFRLNLLGILALFVGSAVVRSLLAREREIYLNSLRLNLIRDIRVELYSAIAHANWSFLRRHRTADLLATLTAETDRLDSAVHFALEMPGRAAMIAAHLAVACLISPWLTIGALTTGLLLAWVVRGRLVESLRLGNTLTTAYKNFHHQIFDFLAGLKITKSYVAEDRYVTAFANAIDDVKDNLLRYIGSQSNARLFQEISGACAIATFLWTSVGLLHMPIAEVLVLSLIFYRLLPLVQATQQSSQQLLHAAPAAQTILSLYRACDAAREKPHGQSQRRFALESRVRLERVSFTHEEYGPVVLDNVDLILPAKTLTILSGSSGAGKSTLLDLVAGLLRPTDGAIWIDDRKLADEFAHTWRHSIAYVLQDPFLFHDTIRANLLVSKPDASDRQIDAALVLAGAAALVDALPRRLETVVGDRGARFSGGERQRLALARALLREPALLILDEPSSSLDATNERAVLESIEGLRGRVTMIVATHRPERVRSPDQIIRIQDGKLERVGKMIAL